MMLSGLYTCTCPIVTSEYTEVYVHATEFPECREINAHSHTVRTRPAFWDRPGNETSLHYIYSDINGSSTQCMYMYLAAD